MNDELKSRMAKDPNGLMTYEYIANNIDNIQDDIDFLVDNIIKVDRNGQFSVSTARYLHAIDRQAFAASIDRLIKASIEKDRERVYLADLAATIWGPDYKQNANTLAAQDDNFRRIYKRLYPSTTSL